MEQAEAFALKSKFDKDGFVIVRRFMGAEEVAEVCHHAEAILAKRETFDGRFTNITKGLEKSDDYFDRLLREGPQVAILEMLIGTKAEPTTASLFTKDRLNEEVHPHSDAILGGVTWIALDPTDRDNGCLHFIKGSHLNRAAFAHLEPHVSHDLTSHPDVVEAIMEPGDIVFFHPTTVHWSGPNYNGLARRGFNCFYTGDSFSAKKTR